MTLNPIFGVAPDASKDIPLVDGLVGRPAMNFRKDQDTGIYRPSTNILALVTQGAEAINIDADGAVTEPLQPAFLAHNSVTDDNVTGNTGAATVDFDTEIFDQGADFASDTFTAPVTGRYLLTANVRVGGVTTAADTYEIIIATSNRTYNNQYVLVNGLGSTIPMELTIVADMDASDTVTVTVNVTGEASDVVDIVGSSELLTSFSGCLLA